MVQVEIFATLSQSVAGATLVAQKQVNEWLKQHPAIGLDDFRLQTQVIREAPEIIWCVISVTYRIVGGSPDLQPAYDI